MANKCVICQNKKVIKNKVYCKDCKPDVIKARIEVLDREIDIQNGIKGSGVMLGIPFYHKKCPKCSRFIYKTTDSFAKDELCTRCTKDYFLKEECDAGTV